MSYVDSGTKDINVMTILCKMQNLYTSKTLVTKKGIDNFSQ